MNRRGIQRKRQKLSGAMMAENLERIRTVCECILQCQMNLKDIF
jgi:hypothetical protein